MSKFLIRPAKPEDILNLMAIFASARAFMKAAGNPNQWEDSYPSQSLIESDIASGNLYAVTADNEIHGVFALIAGIEPTYAKIDGAWLNSQPYATLHRIAGDGNAHGIFEAAVAFAKASYRNVRIDTYKDNRVMRRLIEKHGFQYCGIINIEARPNCPNRIRRGLHFSGCGRLPGAQPIFTVTVILGERFSLT